MTWLYSVLGVLALMGMVAVILRDGRRVEDHRRAARAVTEALTFREVDHGE